MSGSVAVLIKTYGRETAFLNCVRSVREHLRLPFRLYVADDGYVAERKGRLYSELESEGHVVLRLTEPIGASQARNLLLNTLRDEAFVLRMDDDFELTAETDVPAMAALLDHVPELGAVAGLERQRGLGKGLFSGMISAAQGYFAVRDRTLVKMFVPLSEFEYREVAGVRYALADFTRNFLLVRRAVFETIRWDERLPFAGEHADFLLQLRASGWKVGFTPQSVHLHREDLPPQDDPVAYRTQKRTWPGYGEVFATKWGVERVELKRPLSHVIRAGLVRGLLAIRERAPQF